jgi:hypothetical protein
MSTKGERQSLRNEIKSRAYAVLAFLKEPLTTPLTVRVADRTHQTVIAISPGGLGAAATEVQGGLFLSALEAAIVGALDHETFLIAKQIATRCGQRCTGKLKVLIANLCDREILEKNPEGQGYRLHRTFRQSERKPAS